MKNLLHFINRIFFKIKKIVYFAALKLKGECSLR